jgi:hypothetical protein
MPKVRNIDSADRGWRPKYALLPALSEVELLFLEGAGYFAPIIEMTGGYRIEQAIYNQSQGNGTPIAIERVPVM